MWTWRDAVVSAVIVIALGFSLWLKAGASIGGTVVAGEVTAKREVIQMPLQDTWRHGFEISYRYQPLEAPYPVTESHSVDATLYDRLRVGSAVKVRYRRAPLGRMFGFESALDGTTPWSRMASESELRRERLELVAFGVTGVFVFVAYRRKSWPLGLVAATVGATVAASVLSFGFLVFPILFWAWRANPRRGFGWVLLCSTALTTVVLYYRIPWPAPSRGPLSHAVAVVRDVHTVDQIWASSSSSGESTGGQPIRRPFQMVDLEFTPDDRAEGVHALDRVDPASVPGLVRGATVPVAYPVADPRSARMTVGTRAYALDAFVYVLGLTYGIGSVLVFLAYPVIALTRRFARLPLLSAISEPIERPRKDR